MLAAEQRAELRLLEAPGRGLELLRGLAQRVRVAGLGAELGQDQGVVEGALERLEQAELALEPALLAQDPLGPLAVLPQVRALGLAREAREALPSRSGSKTPPELGEARAQLAQALVELSGIDGSCGRLTHAVSRPPVRPSALPRRSAAAASPAAPAQQAAAKTSPWRA